jgi:hypothetical protein
MYVFEENLQACTKVGQIILRLKSIDRRFENWININSNLLSAIMDS